MRALGNSVVSSLRWNRGSTGTLPAQLKEALSNQNWGSPNTLLYDIAAQASFQLQPILEAINQALNERDGRRWRRVWKALNLIEVILKHGENPLFVEAMRAEQWRVMRFVDFRFQENGKDVTAGIREKAKRVQTLLNSPDVLQKERSEARQIAQKLTSGPPLPPTAGPMVGAQSGIDAGTGTGQLFTTGGAPGGVAPPQTGLGGSTIGGGAPSDLFGGRAFDGSVHDVRLAPPPQTLAPPQPLAGSQFRQEDAAQLMNVCGCSVEEARKLLIESGNNLETACDRFFTGNAT
mmetsp:Transcript_19242/g.48136  ORF Transcript_19242/g.48136 Transcript_19242/m.48136 type:complete len:291 (+) Transcript_19242:170-1042(+)|eukprot:CAMPEP_0179009060 /NCGR_PEP_ID=MMETSP0795-20121207/16070_1 /TAXON_ID=88552 /ORGANISM="Amoebophrya sp., Strain Ameob2" /LENGTH=290 /DNA_ID=CAMNT_0020704231 /DNA_START=95 /DNA_END=967 /DNA_ORIENTATION=+